MKMARLVALFGFFFSAAGATAAPARASPLILTQQPPSSISADLTTYVNATQLAWPKYVAVASCSGLYNRAPGSFNLPGPVYLIGNSSDQEWLRLLQNITVIPPTIDSATFLATCLESDNGPAGGRYIPFNATLQQALLPNIVTLGGVLDAIPVDVGGKSGILPSASDKVAFDALNRFADFTPSKATQFVYANYVNETTGISKSDPGYNQTGEHIFDLTISKPPAVLLTDFIVKERIFNIYLPLGCWPLSEQHTLLNQIVNNNPWNKPIEFFGYDHSFAIFGGDTFEAETACVNGVGAGQIASDTVANLGYFSSSARFPPEAQLSPLPSNADVEADYDPTKTYVAFLVGDGDNVGYLYGSRRRWLHDRVSGCGGKRCAFPLLWTMNPHVMHIAPAWASWFAEQLLLTETDRFALPPSGDLYAYPSLFPSADQDTFVANTERDARLLATNISTSWEVVASWEHALHEYFPRYARNGVLTGLVGVNVPYMVPVLAFGDKFFKVVHSDNDDDDDVAAAAAAAAAAASSEAVVFRPNEWRGISGSDEQNLNISAFAAKINGYPKGTVSPIYITSDGGANMTDIFNLVAALDDHVVVAGNEIAQLAIQAASKNQERS